VALTGAAFFIARMTTDELAQVFAAPRPVAVLLPVGAIEPHGPHLPLDTDLIISRAAAARAVALLDAGGVRALKRPTEPPLTPDSPMIALAYRCLQREHRALLRWQHQQGVAPTPASVHQTRIATRRMRVALRLFGALLPKTAATRLAKDLRWFARALGSVRDLDVHAERLRVQLRSAEPAAARELSAYELALRRERSVARAALLTLSASARCAACTW